MRLVLYFFDMIVAVVKRKNP